MTETLDPPTEQPAAAPVTHPVAVLVQRLSARLDEVVAGPAVWSMPTEEQVPTLRELVKVQRQLDALRLQVLIEADRSNATTTASPGAASAADWAAVETQQHRTQARKELAVADMLVRYRHLEAGMLAGTVSVDQALIIKKAIERLPQDGPHAVTWDQVEHAERDLVDLARDHGPETLERLGSKIFEVVAPEVAEAAEGEILARQEARAAAKTSLRMWRDGEGTTHGRFAVSDLHGQMLKTALQALMSPARETAHQTATETGNENTGGGGTRSAWADVPVERRRGQAFGELIERLRVDDLPTAGGGDATIVVTIDSHHLHDTLTEAGVATLDTGLTMSAGEARRIACGHRLLPAVLGTGSQPLDLGMSARLFSKAQRLALALRDGGCTAEHCTVPASMCHAHHDQPWSQRGPTDLANGRLLCGPHHRRVHDPAYGHRVSADNKIQFHRRT